MQHVLQVFQPKPQHPPPQRSIRGGCTEYRYPIDTISLLFTLVRSLIKLELARFQLEARATCIIPDTRHVLHAVHRLFSIKKCSVTHNYVCAVRGPPLNRVPLKRGTSTERAAS